jgi:hypothetical protein
MKSRLMILSAMCALASFQGCQWMAQLDADRTAEQAQLDDAACAERGYSWPGDAYTECRRQRADERQREQWQELQMSRQQGQPEVGVRAGSSLEPYRPIPENRFQCEEEVDDTGRRYIDCSEEGG